MSRGCGSTTAEGRASGLTNFAVASRITKDVGKGVDTLQRFGAPARARPAAPAFTAWGIAIIGQSGLQHLSKSAAWGHGAAANNGITPMQSTITVATSLVTYLIPNLS